jgi:hypothetical protein
MNGSTKAESLVYMIIITTDATVNGKNCIIPKVVIENQKVVDRTFFCPLDSVSLSYISKQMVAARVEIDYRNTKPNVTIAQRASPYTSLSSIPSTFGLRLLLDEAFLTPKY